VSRLTTEEFIARAHKRHGNRYDYARTRYQNCSTPVLIICRVHGPFSQTPEGHLAGKGCNHCAGNRRRTHQEKIQDFRRVHGDRYSYDTATLTNNKRRIRAICKDHGPFQVSHYKHLKGAGCLHCTGHYHHQAKRYFVKRARAVHGDKYTYGRYTKAVKKMQITCPVHGYFSQSPSSHLRGHACPGCANDRKRLLAKGGYSEAFFVLHPDMKEHRAVFYIVEFFRAGEMFLKVGITRTSIKSRLKSGYRQYRRTLIVSRILSLYQAFCLEQKVLKAFKHLQVFPQQNLFVGKTECLASSCVEEVLKWLEDHEDEFITETEATSPNQALST
jgi:hypothetical protein